MFSLRLKIAWPFLLLGLLFLYCEFIPKTLRKMYILFLNTLNASGNHVPTRVFCFSFFFKTPSWSPFPLAPSFTSCSPAFLFQNITTSVLTLRQGIPVVVNAASAFLTPAFPRHRRRGRVFLFLQSLSRRSGNVRVNKNKRVNKWMNEWDLYA